MPRRGAVPRRALPPDPIYQSEVVTRFVTKLMRDGKKALAQRIFYSAMDIVGTKTKRNPAEVLDVAVRNAMPVLEVRPRRVGGATYQVPTEVRPERRLALALRWLVQHARARSERGMAHRLAAEVLDAANNSGATIRKKEDVHRMAEANKAFAHYRW